MSMSSYTDSIQSKVQHHKLVTSTSTWSPFHGLPPWVVTWKFRSTFIAIFVLNVANAILAVKNLLLNTHTILGSLTLTLVTVGISLQLVHWYRVWRARDLHHSLGAIPLWTSMIGYAGVSFAGTLLWVLAAFSHMVVLTDDRSKHLKSALPIVVIVIHAVIVTSAVVPYGYCFVVLKQFTLTKQKQMEYFVEDVDYAYKKESRHFLKRANTRITKIPLVMLPIQLTYLSSSFFSGIQEDH